MNFSATALVGLLLLARSSAATAFVEPAGRSMPHPAAAATPSRQSHSSALLLSSSSSSSSAQRTTSSSTTTTTTEEEEDPLGLTPELRRMTNAFQAIGDDKLRYKQLLYMANQLEKCPAEIMVPENKVPGCLSTVYVDGTARYDASQQDYVIQYVGDSDGLLTKGLVALLIRGLSGCTAEQIQKVDPKFIHEAGISQSLTPGRNNGFLNMLNVMKKKATAALTTTKEEEKAAKSGTSSGSSIDDDDSSSSSQPQEEESSSDRPMYDAMMEALSKLQPTRIVLEDVSHQHAGHAGTKGFDEGESHFELTIVADAFDGLNLVKRHQLIYMLLADVMPKIHALQIQANTPQEVGHDDDDDEKE